MFFGEAVRLVWEWTGVVCFGSEYESESRAAPYGAWHQAPAVVPRERATMRYALSLNPTGAPSLRASFDQIYVGHRLPETLRDMSIEGQTLGHTHTVEIGALRALPSMYFCAASRCEPDAPGHIATHLAPPSSPFRERL
ncbi:hypothetical protein HETIRDRAFT_104409 [Heterobasidion irregulare TC 32-1]|uniref:Uncharacterized protein n=1 Tax=Heterobasidion irregulare (strain TC 32-1) TaxID=747525 RepID=W4K054_HETIT|nr:uncharacterized protein HETIRDRAFT_104409 [Heterobasidion irregulare TC 32-1]ETW79109.1 hypothetical protein HETIRDRAFT_104409 [Heterobasidion irregulare TC 32-1]